MTTCTDCKGLGYFLDEEQERVPCGECVRRDRDEQIIQRLQVCVLALHWTSMRSDSAFVLIEESRLKQVIHDLKAIAKQLQATSHVGLPVTGVAKHKEHHV